MRGVGAAAVAAAVTVVLAGCGGTGGHAAAKAPTEKPAVPAEKRTMPHETVRGDVLAASAAGGFGRPEFRAYSGRLGDCAVSAFAATEADPDPKAVTEVAAELKARGWAQEEHRAESGSEVWLLKKGGWNGDLVTGAAAREEAAIDLPADRQGEAADFHGLTFFASVPGCGHDFTTAPASP